jgi:flagellar biogenesis protein FliO
LPRASDEIPPPTVVVEASADEQEVEEEERSTGLLVGSILAIVVLVGVYAFMLYREMKDRDRKVKKARRALRTDEQNTPEVKYEATRR